MFTATRVALLGAQPVKHGLLDSGGSGLHMSQQVSSFGNLSMATKTVLPHMDKNDMNRGAWWQYDQTKSWHFPKPMRGKGMEYRKHFGEERFITPFYNGGPMEAVHDPNKNRSFYGEWDFSRDLRRAKWPEAHIRTQGYPRYQINHYSKAALKVIAQKSRQATDRTLMWNPHTPQQPVEGPSLVSMEEMDVYRRQAFLVGVEFPEFPDVVPQKQVDPWAESEEHAVPELDNDLLLDREVWDDVNKNMKGMEQRIKAFKDVERKRRYTFEMAQLMQQLKRARQEEQFMRKVQNRTQQKARIEQQEKLKPWERKAREAAKSNESVTEEMEVESSTREVRKEQHRAKVVAGTFRPPGTKL
eukprot:TRINITY_DN35679_c0_g1_i1.p2 TRINITY_DN35679_c0_g1~~TRINITY_DN35679_c0_g1_i1.p2  ORF type:complete len:357 (+),score=147.95 TRINITY_DN35679_c0_g1_i1:262-1332(+)